jgi:uncharacterized RDD family membrane protein YckC
VERVQLDGSVDDQKVDVLHAEFWQRAVAYTIDWVVVFTLAQLLYVALPVDLAMALNLLFPFAYFAWCNGELGRTLGKRLLGLHVVDQESGARIGFGRALLRHLTFFLLFIALLIPGIVNVLFPLWDKRRQTLHDKVVRSVVVAVVRPYTEPA